MKRDRRDHTEPKQNHLADGPAAAHPEGALSLEEPERALDLEVKRTLDQRAVADSTVEGERWSRGLCVRGAADGNETEGEEIEGPIHDV
jgi:hypothetical protein